MDQVGRALEPVHVRIFNLAEIFISVTLSKHIDMQIVFHLMIVPALLKPLPLREITPDNLARKLR